MEAHPAAVLSLWRGWLHRTPTMREIAEEVASGAGCGILDLKGPDRRRPIAWARQEAMWRMHKEAGRPLSQIGRFLGGRDHSTVWYGVIAHERRLADV